MAITHTRCPGSSPTPTRPQLQCALESRRLPQERVLSPYTCLLVETGRHTLLVDTGAGEYASTTGAIQARLEVAGIRPRDVDTVILTHAHPDHIGGAIDRVGRPAFPNARYVLSEIEWEFWTAARANLSHLRVPEDAKSGIHSMARRCLGPLRYQIEPVNRETEVVPGVTVIPAPGHTPGHLAVLIASDGEPAQPGRCRRPPPPPGTAEWQNGLIWRSMPPSPLAQPGRARRRENMHLMAFHFPFPSIGPVAAVATRRLAVDSGLVTNC